MPGARQAISRLRARGPRRLVPPGESTEAGSAVDASSDHASADAAHHGGSVDAAGGSGQAPGSAGAIPPAARTWARGGNGPSSGTRTRSDATPADPEAATPATPGRPKGLTRRGRVRRRMWLDHGPGYRIWAGGPVPPGAAAWTLGRWVIVRRGHAHNARLLAHEEEHVRQWDERGRVGFLAWYLRGYLTWRLRGYPHAAAYRRIPAEVEADWRSRRRLGIGTVATPTTPTSTATPPDR